MTTHLLKQIKLDYMSPVVAEFADTWCGADGTVAVEPIFADCEKCSAARAEAAHRIGPPVPIPLCGAELGCFRCTREAGHVGMHAGPSQ